ncbi:MAG: DUF1343 domain-containing protein, partial [Synergistales bacterium]|nr:DUF1343 domain-containing protein [Synergistales bacterium]
DYPDAYSLKNLNTLLLHTPTMEAIRHGDSLSQIHSLWAPELKDFKKRRAAYLLYR